MWRAIDKEGEELDVLVAKRRNMETPLKLLKRLLKGQGYVPDIIVPGISAHASQPCGPRPSQGPVQQVVCEQRSGHEDRRTFERTFAQLPQRLVCLR